MNHPFFGLSLIIHSLVILISRLRKRPLFRYYRRFNRPGILTYIYSIAIISAMAAFFIGSGAYLIDQGIKGGNNIDYALSAIEYVKAHSINGAEATVHNDMEVILSEGL